MKTNILRILLLGLVSISAIAASAYDFEYDGMYYDIVSTGDLTCKVVSGENPYSGDVVIPESVMFKNRTLKVISINPSTFRDCELTSVNIPKSITSIGDSAFENCKALTSIDIPESITSIGQSAFQGCSGLTSVTVPSSLSSLTNGIGAYMFANCSGLSSVTILSEYISTCMFSNCIKLTSVTMKKVRYIDSFAFANCRSLSSFVIPGSVYRLEDGIFSNCRNLESVIIPNSITEIPEDMFKDCINISSVTIPNSVSYIDESAFEGCSSLSTVEFEAGPKILTLCNFYNKDWIYSPFYGTSITKMTLGRQVRTSYEVQCYAPWFYKIELDKITDLEILDNTNVTSLFKKDGTSGFYWVPNFLKTLKTLTLGKDLSGWETEEALFSTADSLTSITLSDPTPILKCPAFTKKQYLDMTIYVPKGSLQAYQNAPGWKNFWNIMEVEESGIDDVTATNREKIETGRYDLYGRTVKDDYKGVVIIRYSDGSAKKVLNR